MRKYMAIMTGIFLTNLVAAAPAEAQVLTPITYTTTTSDPILPFHMQLSSMSPCPTSFNPKSFDSHYKTIPFTVSATGTYHNPEQPETQRGMIAVYKNSFDASNPALNCVGLSWYAGSNIILETNTDYILVASSYSTETTTVTYAFNGPGSLNITPSAAPVPTLTEWAMILFALALAGSAGLLIHRRRQAA